MTARRYCSVSAMRYKKGYKCQIPGLEDMYMDIFGYKTNGWFIEVGGFDCYTWSNTWPLAIAGWRGIYYEPQPSLVAKCNERYKDMPNVTVCQAALSDAPGREALYLGGSLSTLSEQVKDIYLRLPWARITGHGDGKTMMVDVSTLDVELEKYSVPIGFDVLVIDVEGNEVSTLRGLSIHKWLPKMCIVETHDMLKDSELSLKSPIIDAYFDVANYEKTYTDTINSIYIIKESDHDSGS